MSSDVCVLFWSYFVPSNHLNYLSLNHKQFLCLTFRFHCSKNAFTSSTQTFFKIEDLQCYQKSFWNILKTCNFHSLVYGLCPKKVCTHLHGPPFVFYLQFRNLKIAFTSYVSMFLPKTDLQFVKHVSFSFFLSFLK